MTAHDHELFDRAPCGLLEAASDGPIRRVNATFCEWLGYTRDELTGRRFQDLLTVGGRIFHHTHWAPLLRMQGSVSEVKLELEHRNGSSIPMVLNAIQRADGGVTIDYIAAYVARDRDRYEQELVRSRLRLEELVAQLGELNAKEQTRARFAEQMIGIVSHDLRNPLSVIQMATAMLARVAAPGEQTYVARIDRAVQRANGLIADLLDLTRARLGGGIAVAPVELALHDVVGDAVDELRHVNPTRTIVHVREGEQACHADPARLAQVVGNLVSNAHAYGRPSTTITVTSRIDDECSIAVHNEGTPIARELQEALFEPMTRGTDAGARSRSVGLGLFIVREIARAHGGRATVTSSEREGTTFRITWPR